MVKSFIFPYSNGYYVNKEIIEDLNLDIIASHMFENDERFQKAFFHTLPDIDSITFRQGIFKDLLVEENFQVINQFIDQMRSVQSIETISKKSYYNIYKALWHIDAVGRYCKGIEDFLKSIDYELLSSEALREFVIYIKELSDSSQFKQLCEKVSKIKDDLKKLYIVINIRNNKIEVLNGVYEDWRELIEDTFKVFYDPSIRAEEVETTFYSGENWIEARILEIFFKQYTNLLPVIKNFYEESQNFFDNYIKLFSEDIPFYLKAIETFKKLYPMPYTIPKINKNSNEVKIKRMYDLSLAILKKSEIVSNDFHILEGEKIFFIIGPNQSGKTTLARALGQVFYLSKIGFPIPAEHAEIFFPSNIYTLFEKEEEIENMKSRLELDLVKIKNILEKTDQKSVLILNEVLSSTTSEDAVYIGLKLCEKIFKKGCICMWVTFLKKLTEDFKKGVIYSAVFGKKDLSERTFLFSRDGFYDRSYATYIAEKYGLSSKIIERMILGDT